MSVRSVSLIGLFLVLALLAGCSQGAQPTPTPAVVATQAVLPQSPTSAVATPVVAPTSAAAAASPQTPGAGAAAAPTQATTGTAVAGAVATPGGLDLSATLATTGSLAALGAPVFLQHCSPCHGVEGQGVVGPALRNSQYVQASGDQTVFNTIANGLSTQMPAWLQANGGPLDNTQIAEVVAYLHTLQGVSPVPPSTPLPPEPTETPPPAGAPTPEPALPSQSGQPGQAVSLTGDPTRGKVLFGLYCAACHGPEGIQGNPNPDSDDGTVPALNPIDPSLVNSDTKVFAANIDMFIEHGSVPSGRNPLLKMPSFGDSKMLTPQEIADLNAYVMSLNQGK